MRSSAHEKQANETALRIKRQLTADEWMKGYTPIGIILGTGWGDALVSSNQRSISLSELPGFRFRNHIPGHARNLELGRLAGRNVAILRGRIHLNEAPDDSELPKMVRLQTEMLIAFGVRTLIVTNGAGSLTPRRPDGEPSGLHAAPIGSICIIAGFVTTHAPPMPLWAGEFCSPEDILDPGLQRIAHEQRGPLTVTSGGYAMVRGPFFEGRKYDKPNLARDGATVVGMSTLPEACVASLYAKEGVRMLGLSFVTNNDTDLHSHEANLAQARAAGAQLSDYLTRIVTAL